MSAPQPQPAFDLERRTAQYVQLRDKIAEIKQRHSAELEPYNTALFKLGGVLLQHLQSTKAQSAASAAGTIYRTERVSVTIKDPQAFRQHVLETEDWELVDWRANKTVIRDQVDAHAKAIADGKLPNTVGLPPGLNFTREYVVGVQRS